MKKLLTALAISAMALSATAQTKELKVAIDPTYEPFTFKTPDGKPTGFDVDIAECAVQARSSASACTSNRCGTA